ncbi:MAG TPA: LD-carboxypeptidase [Terriglobales bacterium]|nr:LD-carboxypeptidase [Terriglobales bacterium]
MPQNPAKPRIKPPALLPGDPVGIVAPASNIQPAMLQAGVEALHKLGYKPVYLGSIFDRDLYFAGTLDRRAKELEEMFVRDDVRAILCARGGYGSNYLLSKLDPQKIVPNPKIFVGYSDITTLLTCFADAAGMVTFHGPMVTKDFANPDGVDLASWEAAVGGLSHWKLDLGPGVEALAEGEAEGILYGGCLSMLAASLGTPHEIRTHGTILFIEDIAAKPFQIDRMLMQLKLAGKLKQVRGIVFGEMIDCLQSRDQDYTLKEVILRVVGDLGIPIAYGLRSGHVSRRNVTLPIGVRTALKVTKTDITMEILESATTPVAVPVQTKS